MCIYAVNVNKKWALQKINCEKCVNFAGVQRIKHIFIQPIAKKHAGLTDFRQYDLKCIQPLAKKSHVLQKIIV